MLGPNRYPSRTAHIKGEKHSTAGAPRGRPDTASAHRIGVRNVVGSGRGARGKAESRNEGLRDEEGHAETLTS